MKNIIIENCIKSFKNDYGIHESKEDVSFEHFANFCVFGKYCQEAYQEDPTFYEDIHTGEGGDYGIDGILVLVNDQPITTIEHLDTINSKKWRVRIIFVQAKTSANFDSGELLKTGNGIFDIMNFDTKRANKKISAYISILKAIYEQSERFEYNPICSIFFVTTGTWTSDGNLVHVMEKIKNDIQNLRMTSLTEFIPVDNNRIVRMYREITQSITKTIQMMKAVPFPTINGVNEAYVGLIKIHELLKLITDGDGMLQNNLFYENVRSFLGFNNAVNREIYNTLSSREEVFRFPILNNGVTIVAKELKHVGDNFTLSNFQIVNGCQTCNVIYDCRDKQIDDAYCSMKIICTENTDIITEVIKSTNKQTTVLDEAFESLKSIHKKIQDYFEAVVPAHRLYYERRAREFDNTNDINRHRVVTLTTLINASVSMFLEEPHSTHRYYGELLKAYNGKLFNNDDKPVAYYTAVWCLFRVDSIFASDPAYISIRKYRYHFILLISYLAAKRPSRIRLSSSETVKYCNKICENINDDKKFKELMTKTTSIVLSCLESMGNMSQDNNNNVVRRKEFTVALLDRVRKCANHLNK